MIEATCTSEHLAGQPQGQNGWPWRRRPQQQQQQQLRPRPSARLGPQRPAPGCRCAFESRKSQRRKGDFNQKPVCFSGSSSSSLSAGSSSSICNSRKFVILLGYYAIGFLASTSISSSQLANCSIQPDDQQHLHQHQYQHQDAATRHNLQQEHQQASPTQLATTSTNTGKSRRAS